MINADKILGGIIGLCVGDALGVPVEFEKRESLNRNPVTDMRGYGTHDQPPGTWSDDTSLTLCLLDSLANGLDYDDIMRKFLAWKNEAEYTAHGERFDIGQATCAALLRFSQGTEPLKCGGTDEYDNGNGSLMRILPLIFELRSVYGNDFVKEKEAYNIIHNVSALTHATKRCKIACGIYLCIANFLIDDKKDLKSTAPAVNLGLYVAKKYYGKTSEWADEFKHYSRIYKRGFIKLPEESIQSTGYVVHTLEAALWCLMNTGNYKDCVLKAVNLGGDTDTTAAVAGGLAGMYYGIEAIPAQWVEQIARIDYIKDICKRIM